MPYPTKRIHFRELIFDVNDDVYEPAEDSFLFAENLHVAAGEAVLDLGTGSGILAAVAAKTAGSVVAMDVNPYAVRCAKDAARLNGVREKIDFILGDLFTALKTGVMFDLILFNAPYLPSEAGEEETWIGRSWAGGADGRQVVDKFIAEVPAYLKSHGRVLLMQSTLTGVEETLSGFKKHGLKAFVVAEQKLPFFETLTLIQAKASE
jgi:release factor glutamine methyltransferase